MYSRPNFTGWVLDMFGEILQELRKDKGWKQSDLAERLGMSKSAIGAYETGVSEPSIENLIKIADLFHVNIDYLVGHCRESISWSDMVSELPLESGSISVSAVNDILRALDLHDRSAVVEHMIKLKSLLDLKKQLSGGHKL